MVGEVLEGLVKAAGGDALFVDGTVGTGGHAEALLQACPGGRLIGIDRDPEALALAAERLRPYGDRVRLLRGHYADLPALLTGEGIGQVDGILLDLGVSELQIGEERRGFSFMKEGPLDMRMDRGADQTAADLVNRASEAELRRILREWGEERWAPVIARAIVRARRASPLTTTTQLAALVARAIPARHHPRRIHPATKTFQAIRIAVNRELERLEEALDRGVPLLKPEGRLCVITYHSLEDRMVKQTLQRLAQGCICPPRLPVCVCGRRPVVRVVTRRPVQPRPEEIARNPRARSAKLRIAERLAASGSQDNPPTPPLVKGGKGGFENSGVRS
jgi:16S rRNA (cytosine1402-N4)-methyltransferase